MEDREGYIEGQGNAVIKNNITELFFNAFHYLRYIRNLEVRMLKHEKALIRKANIIGRITGLLALAITVVSVYLIHNWKHNVGLDIAGFVVIGLICLVAWFAFASPLALRKMWTVLNHDTDLRNSQLMENVHTALFLQHVFKVAVDKWKKTFDIHADWQIEYLPNAIETKCRKNGFAMYGENATLKKDWSLDVNLPFTYEDKVLTLTKIQVTNLWNLFENPVQRERDVIEVEFVTLFEETGKNLKHENVLKQSVSLDIHQLF